MDTIEHLDNHDQHWPAVLDAAFNGGASPRDDNSLWPIYAPLIEAPRDRCFVVGQIGQSLDGRIATVAGDSRYVNGMAALVHLHRLRALVDAIVVGVGTVVADDPQLNVRHVAGHLSPARVVLDPSGRMPQEAKCLCDDGAGRIVIHTGESSLKLAAGIETICVPPMDGVMSPDAILAALHARGLHRILVEGGATTLSRFLAAGCLNRLHVMTAPLIIGSGVPALNLPVVEKLENALRPQVRAYAFSDGDVLFDCDFSAR